jgi:hypothetical protein
VFESITHRGVSAATADSPRRGEEDGVGDARVGSGRRDMSRSSSLRSTVTPATPPAPASPPLALCADGKKGENEEKGEKEEEEEDEAEDADEAEEEADDEAEGG